MDLSKKITDFVCGNDSANEDERSIIEFGVSVLISKSINMITEIIIGCLFFMVKETIIFLIAFTFLRSYAGGFHASSSRRCYISSTATMVLALLVIKYLNGYIVNIIFALFGIIVCLLFAPVESRNKPIDEIEKKVYRKRTMLILSIIFIAFTVSLLLNIDTIFVTLSVVLLTEGIMLILGKITLRKR